MNNAEDYKQAIAEILSEVLPMTGANVGSWRLNVAGDGVEGDEGIV